MLASPTLPYLWSAMAALDRNAAPTAAGRSDAVPDVEARVAAGDRGALEAVLREHAGAIARLCHGMSHPGEGRDATQEALEKIVRNVRRFDPARGAFRTWAFQVARNVCRDRLRKRRPETPVYGRPDVAAPGPDPERATAARDEAGQVARALETLPEGMRRAIVLYHLEGRSYDAIARELDVPPGTVMTWLHRGRRRLREAVEAEA